MSWEQEEGDARRFGGTWSLEPAARGMVRATYTVQLDLGWAMGVVFGGRLGSKLGERFIDPMPLRLREHVQALAA